MTQQQRDFLKLVARSGPQGTDCKVSATLANMVRGFMAKNPEIAELISLTETEEGPRVRLTTAGMLVLRWQP